MGMENNHISLNSSAIVQILGLVACLVVIASIGVQFAKFVLGLDGINEVALLFYIDGEGNIPTFFSVFLLFISTLLLAVITLHKKKYRAPYVSKWVVLSFGFMFMAYDEAFQVHEKLIIPMRTILGGHDLGIFYFAWVVPGIAFVIVLGLFFLKFLLHLPAKTRLSFLMAATLYIGGIIGVELIGGRYAELNGMENFTYSIIVTIEESLEMAGIIIFIWALLNYCADDNIKIRFRN